MTPDPTDAQVEAACEAFSTTIDAINPIGKTDDEMLYIAMRAALAAAEAKAWRPMDELVCEDQRCVGIFEHREGGLVMQPFTAFRAGFNRAMWLLWRPYCAMPDLSATPPEPSNG